MTDLNIETLRQGTKMFIDMDPTTISLIPVSNVRQPGGGYAMVDGSPRAPQTFKLIWQGGINSGISASIDGQNIQFDMILLGEWDADMEVGDYWELNGVKYVIQGFSPDNEYEKKAAIRTYGVKPIGG